MEQKSNYPVALTAALGLFMAVLDATIVNVGLVPIARAFKTDVSTVQWVLTGYLLAQAAIIPVAGYLGNRFGTRRIFALSLALFTVGSLLCGLAQDETSLIIFRVIQGIGGGALLPLGQSIAFGAFPPEKRAMAGPIIGVPILLAPAFGPTIGGLIIDNWGWEYMFYVNVPIGIVAIMLAWWIIPAAEKTSESKSRASFDYVGLTLSIVGVLAVVYAFTLVSETRSGTQTALNPRGELNGWGYWLVWVLMGAGVLILAIFAWYELKVSKDPVIDLRLFARYDFTISSVVSWFTAIVIFSSLLLLPVFFQNVRLPHLSAIDTGLALMPQGIAAAFGVAIGGRFYHKLGVRNLVLIGVVLLIISSWQLTNFSPATAGTELIPWLILRGLGFGMTMIPVQTLALQAITGPALAKATSLFNMTRQIAQSIGTAVVVTLFAQQTTQHANELRDQLTRSLPPGVTFDPNSPQAIAAREQLGAQAGTMAVNDVFFILTIGTLLMVGLAIALPNRKKQNGNISQGAEESPAPALMLE